MLKKIEIHCMPESFLLIKKRAKIAVKTGLVAIINDPLIGLAVIKPLLKKYMVRKVPKKAVKNKYHHSFGEKENLIFN